MGKEVKFKKSPSTPQQKLIVNRNWKEIMKPALPSRNHNLYFLVEYISREGWRR
jgi:hypothetical protein